MSLKNTIQSTQVPWSTAGSWGGDIDRDKVVKRISKVTAISFEIGNWDTF